MISGQAIADALEDARGMLGTPYLRGAKWGPKTLAPMSSQDWEQHPVGPVDCSGLSRWVAGRAGVVIPDGSYNQIKVCKKTALAAPRPLDLGFADLTGDGQADHVVVGLSAEEVIEARAKCSQCKGHDPKECPYGKVIIRPVERWNAQKGFLGWYEVNHVYSSWV